MAGIFSGRFYTPFDKDITVLSADISNVREQFENAELIAKNQHQELNTASFLIVLDWFKKELETIYQKDCMTPKRFLESAQRELAVMLYTFKLTESQAMTFGICIGTMYDKLYIAEQIANHYFEG